MKLVCFYLPQFHETEENNKWWGAGYTDWTAAKKATPLFGGHRQPRTPLDNNYYDLSDETAQTLAWQAKLAREYGIYGFCIYHYWFAGKKILYKPVEILRAHPEIDIHYSLCWDSKTWTRTWYAHSQEKEILIEQDYGDERMWTKHFYDLLPYFQDSRYIKKDGKPIFHIYRTEEIPCLVEMKKCWNRLAIQHGFEGIYIISGDLDNRSRKNDSIDAYYNYEPVRSFHEYRTSLYVRMTVIRAGILKRVNALLRTSFFPDKRTAKGIFRLIERKDKKYTKPVYLGIFADYDDTPRRQRKGVVYCHNKPEYFKQCLEIQIKKSISYGNEYIFMNAWNEWGEGAYLEPDSENKYMYLEIIRDVLFTFKEKDDRKV